ncbi:hypothetical protein BD414DRAFT_470498 [Trametes punicea]|nr:hypothetical protein BD414DRAFT_470498 [Trametes punicea]
MSDMAFPGQTVGALMVGGIVGATLYGLTFSQAFRYHNREQKDSFLMRTYVLALWLADTVNVFLMGHVLYYTFVTRYGDPTVFLAPLWSLVSMVLLTSIVSFMVRGVYIKGIWHLSHEHPVIAGVIAVLSVFDFVCGIPVLTLKGYGVNRGDFDSLKVYLCLAFASAIIADLSVAGTLWYLLRGSKARTSRLRSGVQARDYYRPARVIHCQHWIPGSRGCNHRTCYVRGYAAQARLPHALHGPQSPLHKCALRIAELSHIGRVRRPPRLAQCEHGLCSPLSRELRRNRPSRQSTGERSIRSTFLFSAGQGYAGATADTRSVAAQPRYPVRGAHEGRGAGERQRGLQVAIFAGEGAVKA